MASGNRSASTLFEWVKSIKIKPFTTSCVSSSDKMTRNLCKIPFKLGSFFFFTHNFVERKKENKKLQSTTLCSRFFCFPSTLRLVVDIISVQLVVASAAQCWPSGWKNHTKTERKKKRKYFPQAYDLVFPALFVPSLEFKCRQKSLTFLLLLFSFIKYSIFLFSWKFHFIVKTIDFVFERKREAIDSWEKGGRDVKSRFSVYEWKYLVHVHMWINIKLWWVEWWIAKLNRLCRRTWNAFLNQRENEPIY